MLGVYGNLEVAKIEAQKVGGVEIVTWMEYEHLDKWMTKAEATWRSDVIEEENGEWWPHKYIIERFEVWGEDH